MKNPTKLVKITAAVLTATALITPVNATILVNVDFDNGYSTGTLDGPSGSGDVGLSGTWNAATYAANAQIISSTGNDLSYSGEELFRTMLSEARGGMVAVMTAQYVRDEGVVGTWFTDTYEYLKNEIDSPDNLNVPSDRGIGKVLSLFCDGSVKGISPEVLSEKREEYLLMDP